MGFVFALLYNGIVFSLYKLGKDKIVTDSEICPVDFDSGTKKKRQILVQKKQ